MSYCKYTVVNAGVHIFFCIRFPLDICPGVGLLNHMIILVLVY